MKIDRLSKRQFNYETGSKIKRQKKSKAHFIVYSDRAFNNVFKDEDALERLPKEKFLAPYYVIDEEKSYLEIVRYQPDLVGKPKGMFSFLKSKKYRFKDQENVQYVGWIHKANVLMHTQAKISPTNFKHKRFLLGFNDRRTLSELGKYIHKDTVLTFEDPRYFNKSKAPFFINQIVYLYKYSADRKSALVSNKFKVSDSVNRVMGWVPSKLLINIGQQQSLLLNENSNIALLDKKTNSKYNFETKRIGSRIVFNTADHNTTVYDQMKDSANVVVPAAVWNHDNNKLISIKGNLIEKDLIAKIERENKVLNFHLVFDCSSNHRIKKMQLMSSLQKLKILLSQPRFFGFKTTYSATSYGCNQQYNFNKSSNFSAWLDFVYKGFQGELESSNTTVNKSLMACVNATMDIENATTYENNIIIVVGDKGFTKDETDDKVLLNTLTKSYSRLLFYQLENSSAVAHQQFILQAKAIIGGLAAANSDYIQDFNVDYNIIKAQNSFVSLKSDANVYVLDSPENSNYQGGLAFPSLEGNITPHDFEMVLDSVITKTINFNQLSLKSRANISKEFSFLRSVPTKNVERMLSSDRLLLEKVNANEMYFKTFYKNKDDGTGAISGYLLNKKELEELIENYRTIVPLFSPKLKKKERRALFKRYYKTAKGINSYVLTKKIKRKSTVASFFLLKTGIPVFDEKLGNLGLKKIKRKRKVTSDELRELSACFSDKIEALEHVLMSKRYAYDFKRTFHDDYYFIPTHLTF